jgi:hypothetical protein
MYNVLRRSVSLLAAVFLLVGCDSTLQEDPRDLVSPGGFFNSAAEVKSAVNGLYEIYHNHSLYGKIGLDRFYENGGDTIGPNREFGQVQPIQNYTLSEGNIGNISQGGGAPLTWQDLYKIIKDSNVILENVRGNENLDQSIRDRYIAETLFLRSLAYYHLTNLWGAVPFYEQNLPISQVRSLGRSPRDSIRDVIIEDLETAQQSLPSSYSSGEQGRASRWAAATVEAKIHLWQENWEEALNACLDIINNSPHRLLDDYSDVFDPNNEYNDEIIWSIDFVKDTNPDDRTDHYVPRIRDEPADPDQRAALIDSLSKYNLGFTGYGLAIPLPDLVEEFPEDDLRRPSNIKTSMFGIELNFPYMPKLWNLDQINSPRGNHGENRIVFRLADVYLMAAEAENELNGPSGAYQYINAVRERAYEPDQPLQGLSQSQLREAIRDERRWELAGEGQRRLDLIRWGILQEVVQNTEYRIYNPAQNIEPRHTLLPIPPEQLRLNPNLLESDPTNNGYR